MLNCDLFGRKLKYYTALLLFLKFRTLRLFLEDHFWDVWDENLQITKHEWNLNWKPFSSQPILQHWGKKLARFDNFLLCVTKHLCGIETFSFRSQTFLAFCFFDGHWKLWAEISPNFYNKISSEKYRDNGGIKNRKSWIRIWNVFHWKNI